MNYQESMLLAINDQSSSITSLQIGQTKSTEFVASLLQNIYSEAQGQLTGVMALMTTLTTLVDALGSNDLGQFFEDYENDHGGNPGTPTKNRDEVNGAFMWMTNFNNSHTYFKVYNNNNYSTNKNDWKHMKDGKVNDSDDWVIEVTYNSKTYTVEGDALVDNFQNYLGIIQTQYQGKQSDYSNIEQGDQTILQDEQSGVESTAQAGSNIISTGSSIVQAMGYTSSLLASAM